MTGRHLAVFAAAANFLMWIGNAQADQIKILPVNDNGGLHSPVIIQLLSGDWALQLPSHAHGPSVLPGEGDDHESGPPSDVGSGDPGDHSGVPPVPPSFNPPPFSDPPPFAGPPSADPPPFSGGGFTPPPFSDNPPPVSNPPVGGPSGPPVDGSGGGSGDSDGPQATTALPEPGSMTLLIAGAMFLVFRSSRLKRSWSRQG
jgi:hypothetical protein